MLMPKTLNAKFVTSAPSLKECPKFLIKEFAMIGRSNVGKSTFINTLANQKNLAKTSQTPGKTRLINLFNFSEKFIIADLPGYGYSKVSQSMQDDWDKHLQNYLLKRENLVCLIHLIDSRHEIQKNDYQMREWIKNYNLPVVTILTKTDCLSRSKINPKVAEVKNIFSGEVFPFSKENSLYTETVLNFLLNYEFKVKD